MRTVAHISDLHFGRVDEALVEPLLNALKQVAPTVVAVSGDLTQRARTAQFEQARDFLNRIPFPIIVVPGNHDVPLYNVAARFMTPLHKYRQHITDDLLPEFIDDEIVVIGVNTARSLTWKDGRINEGQLDAIRTRLAPHRDKTSIVVTHHPFDLPDDQTDDPVGRAKQALAMFAECSVDVLLSGHLHLSHAGETDEDGVEAYSALLVHAGTALSTRGRGETNAFNVLRVEHPTITVERHTWRPERMAFEATDAQRFAQENNRWRRVANADAGGTQPR